MEQLLWWQRGVIYQVYPRSFKDSNSDGIGDLHGVIEKLDYLRDLGIDAVWLSPFYPSPMADFGYDISDFTDVDPMFGTLEDFDELVTEAHNRDIHIIVDFVPNHSSDQHPWFIESRSSRDNPKRDWYFWRDAKPDGSLPNNWLGAFGGSSWEWDEHTQQYYLHNFLVEQPDLNWRNPEVKAAMMDVLRFWLDRGVDGFRLDAVHFMMKHPDLLDNPSNPEMTIGFKSLGEYDSLIHVNDMAHDDIHGIFRDFRTLLNEYSEERPRFSVGEIHMQDWSKWASYYGANLDELHMPFNFHFLFSPWTVRDLQNVINNVESHIPKGAWPNFVLGNHDEHRIASRIGQENARAAMMLLLTLRGTPTIYYGDEIGMHDVEIPAELEQDPWGKNVAGIGLGRDPERTPMQWDDSTNAGFAADGVTPWLPVALDIDTINVETQSSDSRSMLALTRNLLALRRATPALHVGSYRAIPHESCLIFVREHGQEQWLVAINFLNQDTTLTLPEFTSGQIVINTELDRDETVSLSELQLRGNEGCVIRLSK
jgi:alpha-glucosidase